MESMPDLKFEIGHVLFIDIVGYSKLRDAVNSNASRGVTLRHVHERKV
jgi:hypothetical protein